MRVAILTKEYPPELYGGAGVHVTELVQSLSPQVDIVVHCFGKERYQSNVLSYDSKQEYANTPVLATLDVDVSMAAHSQDAQIVHSHTWYTNAAGRLAQMLYGVPHVITAHSLEPLRPWKREQLGGGYEVSCAIERDAYEHADAIIAVSHEMKSDVLKVYPNVDPNRVHVIHNGIDVDRWQPLVNQERLVDLGIALDGAVLAFVGRITHQKGILHLLNAFSRLPEGIQLVLCASAPDTLEIEREVVSRIESLQASGRNIVWLNAALRKEDLRVILTRADIFVCPSIYEPLGIVNLEAMACESAVVATRIGGIPEVVREGDTGWLVPFDEDHEMFAENFAQTVLHALADPDELLRRAKLGRVLAQKNFSWETIAAETIAVYKSLL